MGSNHVIESRDKRGVTTLTVHRPELHNAFDDALILELRGILERLAIDDTCRVVVLAAEGKTFSAGADLGWMKRMASAGKAVNEADARQLAHMMRALDELPKPTIARVQGPAFGGGVGLVACCDIAIAARPAHFSLSEVRIGIIPSVISPYVVGAIGPRAARRLFLTGQRIGAEEALRLGLVHEVVEPEQLDPAVESCVVNLVAGGPKAQGEAKTLVREVKGREIDELLIEETARRIAEIRASDEGREGIVAFIERRRPSWAGGRGA